ncbi:MAG: chorismate-binding protein [Bacteroidetes bacterium]|nr:chorismate-binding protein [Bacteroidota bacterium]
MSTGRVWYRIPGQQPVFMQGSLRDDAVAPSKECFIMKPFDRYARFYMLEPEVKEQVLMPELYSSWHYRSGIYEQGDPYPGETYIQWVEQVKQQLIAGNLAPEDFDFPRIAPKKVVTSRSVFRRLPPEPMRWFERACRLYPQAMVYLFDAPETGCWIGATPEPLLRWESGAGSTMALAGTKSTEAESGFGAKEQDEQGYIRTFIREIFKDLNIPFREEALRELQQGDLKHLCNEFHFNAAPEQVWNLAKQLHPTPAVCGYPRAAALRTLLSERTLRSFYGGFLGPWSPEKVSLWVNIRCGEVFADGINLYAGTGITQDSDARDEFQETEQKLRVLGAVL